MHGNYLICNLSLTTMTYTWKRVFYYLLMTFKILVNYVMSIIRLTVYIFYWIFSWLESLFKEELTFLKLLTDVDMLLMIENCIFSGISMIKRRYSNADVTNTHYNNKKKSHVIALCIGIWITCVAGLCRSISPMTIFNGILQTISQKNGFYFFQMIQKLHIFLKFRRKLLINSIFVKTMMILRKRTNSVFFNTETGKKMLSFLLLNHFNRL